MTSPDLVADYYDRNTGRFLRFGGGRDALAIHRELWGPGVRTATDAKRYVNRLLEDRIGPLRGDADSAAARSLTVVDLGCGVGGTLFDLADRFTDGVMHGVTVSPAQVAMARDLAARRGVADRVHFHLGDFERLGSEDHGPAGVPMDAHAVVAIESFAHASDADAFFRTAARCALRPGGRLLLVDDFLTRPQEALDAPGRKWVRAFSAGWRLGSVLTPDEVAAHAARAGFVVREDLDLTPLVRLGRPRDRAIRVVAPALERLGLSGVPFFGNMVGGNALQEGLRHGVLAYRMLVFEAGAHARD